MKQTTEQLNAQIDSKLLNALDDLKDKTKVSKKALVEQAIRLLLEQHRSMSAVYKNGVVDANFITMIDQSMKPYDQTMKKLAE